jgi:MFS family permease
MTSESLSREPEPHGIRGKALLAYQAASELGVVVAPVLALILIHMAGRDAERIR